MLQKVTLGYFERDEAGRMQSRSREVIVEAASGDDAAARALTEHGPALERLAGYDPGQASGRVAVLGVDTAADDRSQTTDDRSQMTDVREQISGEKEHKKSKIASRATREPRAGRS